MKFGAESGVIIQCQSGYLTSTGLHIEPVDALPISLNVNIFPLAFNFAFLRMEQQDEILYCTIAKFSWP